MRLLIIFSFILLSLANPVWAQDTADTLYNVDGVAVDVTAKTPAQARDAALIQAQRAAFKELMDRLNAGDTYTKKLSDNDLAALVKSFEVQNERASAVRYIGTYNIRFRPNAVRKLLGAAGVSFSEARSRPYLVLAVYIGEGKPILWEETTPWSTAWNNSGPDAGLVPIIVPSGAIEDASIISAAETIEGKAAAIHNLIAKYNAAGALVATLATKPDAVTPTTLSVSLKRYDVNGKKKDAATLTLPPQDGKASPAPQLAQAVIAVRKELDKQWRANPTDTPPAGDSEQNTEDENVSLENQIPSPTAAASPLDGIVTVPTSHVAVAVEITNLADWAMIKRRLESVPDIVQVSVVSLKRGTSDVDLEYRGTTINLQGSIKLAGLDLILDPARNAWVMRWSR